jgi:hypothetical protein
MKTEPLIIDDPVTNRLAKKKRKSPKKVTAAKLIDENPTETFTDVYSRL